MKISRSWLSQYVAASMSPVELAEKLTMAGIEVESMTVSKAIPPGVVAALITERAPHPGADKLSVCKVDAGGGEILQIVCGAPNCDAGKKVPLAKIGAELSGGDSTPFKIKKAKLRGVESFGMLCSGSELGMDDAGGGLLELPADVEVGTELSAVFQPDTLFDLEITPNRPDCLSHWGVAREVSAMTGAELRFPVSPTVRAPCSGDVGFVEVRDQELCPRYIGRVIRGVKVGRSPEWLEKRLLSIGLRPVNNIVDITNFVLQELGHPLHAFDLGLLDGGRVVVRRAEAGEVIMTLDGIERKLSTDTLVIADASKPVALAGVMGGEHSGVLDSTVDILLESAVFAPSNIRSTSRAMGVSTDSSYRFERGVDFDMAEKASERALSLIVELAGAASVSTVLDIQGAPPKIQPILCRIDKVKDILGMELSEQEIVTVFKRLGLGVRKLDVGKIMVTPPSHRRDLARDADLAEEIARIHGLDKIPSAEVRSQIGGPMRADENVRLERTRSEFVAFGLRECMNYTLTDVKSATASGLTDADCIVSLKNPISSDSSVLRPSLLPGMLSTVERNVNRGSHSLALFEMGDVFRASLKPGGEQSLECCLCLYGARHPERYSEDRTLVYDFFDMKGILESLVDARRLGPAEFTETECPAFREGARAELRIHGKTIARFGEAAPALVRGMRLRHALYAAIIDQDALDAMDGAAILYRPISPYPAVARDVAMVADSKLRNSDIIGFIRQKGGEWVERVELFDVFEDERLGQGRRSLAYSVVYRKPDGTLTDEEVNSVQEKVRAALASDLQVELR